MVVTIYNAGKLNSPEVVTLALSVRVRYAKLLLYPPQGAVNVIYLDLYRFLRVRFYGLGVRH